LQKRVAYGRVEPHEYLFVPFSVDMYGRLGQPVMELLHKLGDEADGPGGILRASFVAGALGELSLGLFVGIFFMLCASVGMLARVRGTGFRARTDVPADDLVVYFML
jgi:hypothetical protein